jgi:hypothetical protein
MPLTCKRRRLLSHSPTVLKSFVPKSKNLYLNGQCLRPGLSVNTPAGIALGPVSTPIPIAGAYYTNTLEGIGAETHLTQYNK